MDKAKSIGETRLLSVAYMSGKDQDLVEEGDEDENGGDSNELHGESSDRMRQKDGTETTIVTTTTHMRNLRYQQSHPQALGPSQKPISIGFIAHFALSAFLRCSHQNLFQAPSAARNM